MPEKKDAVDLICSVSELVGLFEKSTGLNDFLQAVVSTVATHSSLTLPAWDGGLDPASEGDRKLRG